jgi:hypothetical protein
VLQFDVQGSAFVPQARDYGVMRVGGVGRQPTRLPLQEEKIFHDLVEFFFDEAARRNMLMSR